MDEQTPIEEPYHVIEGDAPDVGQFVVETFSQPEEL